MGDDAVFAEYSERSKFTSGDKKITNQETRLLQILELCFNEQEKADEEGSDVAVEVLDGAGMHDDWIRNQANFKAKRQQDKDKKQQRARDLDAAEQPYYNHQANLIRRNLPETGGTVTPPRTNDGAHAPVTAPAGTARVPVSSRGGFSAASGGAPVASGAGRPATTHGRRGNGQDPNASLHETDFSRSETIVDLLTGLNAHDGASRLGEPDQQGRENTNLCKELEAQIDIARRSAREAEEDGQILLRNRF